MNKRINLKLVLLLLSLIISCVIFQKFKNTNDKISNHLIEFEEVDYTIYPNEYIWSYRHSNGILEYKKDFGTKYKELSYKGVMDTIIELYEPLYVSYKGKIDVNNLNWEYKINYYYEDDKTKTLDIYLTETSIIIKEYEYLITGNDKVSKDECLIDISETFEWFYKHEMFGEMKTK